ncbi:MAG: hypothetical protein HQM10_06915 [Candidatus Riflebacteria bacterium]|nr:hypothetical protein [Candidatus Riflebacteria bacterium]
MADQAQNLRRLRKAFDTLNPGVIEDSLSLILKSPPPLTRMILFPEKLLPEKKTLLRYLAKLFSTGKSVFICDQAKLLTERDSVPVEKSEFIGSTVENIELPGGLTVRVVPRIDEYLNLYNLSNESRHSFLSSFLKLFFNCDELWITCHESEIIPENPLLHSSDSAYVFTSTDVSEIAFPYKIIKLLHYSKFFYPIIIFDENFVENPFEKAIFERLRRVASQFLALDLRHLQMVDSYLRDGGGFFLKISEILFKSGSGNR